jgi:hypothetical protein
MLHVTVVAERHFEDAVHYSGGYFDQGKPGNVGSDIRLCRLSAMDFLEKATASSTLRHLPEIVECDLDGPLFFKLFFAVGSQCRVSKVGPAFPW